MKGQRICLVGDLKTRWEQMKAFSVHCYAQTFQSHRFTPKMKTFFFIGQAWGEMPTLLPELSVSLGMQEMGMRLPTPPIPCPVVKEIFLFSGYSHTLFAQVNYGSVPWEGSCSLPCYPLGAINL